MQNSLILLQDLDLIYHQNSFQATLRGSDKHTISIWEHTNGLQKARNQLIKSKVDAHHVFAIESANGKEHFRVKLWSVTQSLTV